MACRLAGLSRSAYRRPLQGETTADPDLALRDWLRAYAKKHPRWGYRRAYHDARGEGWVVNHKKIQRLWREEGLRVPQRRRRKRVGSSTVDAPAAVAPNLVWAVDFQFDADEQGRPIKICSIVDEHTRECIGGLVERSITADRLTAHLEDLVAVRGAPAVLRSDNGPEFISDAMAHWAGTRTGLFYIPPGSPWHNGYVESFNSRPPRRVPEHQQLLLAAPRPGRDRRLEDRIQPRPPAFIARLPRTRRLRSAMHPSIGNRRLAQRPDRMKGAAQHGALAPRVSPGCPVERAATCRG
jgi:transposase InsO family protein